MVRSLFASVLIAVAIQATSPLSPVPAGGSPGIWQFDKTPGITNITVDGSLITDPWYKVAPDTYVYRTKAGGVCGLINRSPQGIYYFSITHVHSVFHEPNFADAYAAVTYICANKSATSVVE